VPITFHHPKNLKEHGNGNVFKREKPVCNIIFVGGAVDLKTRIFLDALPKGTARFCAFLTTYISVSRGWGELGWG
jgi:hypothetical protein